MSMILVGVKRKKKRKKEWSNKRERREPCMVHAHWRDSKEGTGEEEEEGRRIEPVNWPMA